MFVPKDRKKEYGTLGFAFGITRALQTLCLILILILSAIFIAEINAADTAPPGVIIATLSIVVITIVCLATIYLLYLDTHLHFLIAAGLDSAALIALIVVSITIGKPLSYLDCPALANVGVTSAFVDSAVDNFSKANSYFWLGASKRSCYEMKAIWGFSLALCVLFFFSGIIDVCLWKIEKKFVPQKDGLSYSG
ncbi:hypothetical protein SBOR_1539 [Sclerotinia borealis F-4128]|uniref:MARVEL domain-containing protein n=1 Tax=Sclerotinia borealis (strain F-4128) TaxID=1432307 RepID=W9CPU2_SCLBF|nr:hypothetical protein SBOR_1539 [Sclerotinia borealis F-4128]